MEPGRPPGRGPFTADQLGDGDRYELTNGHAIYCAPGGGSHGSRNATGAFLLLSELAVEQGGIDVGFTAEPGMLRAPDVAVGNVPGRPGWVKGAPPLAVEYADTGTDEADLRAKTGELLSAGAQQVWVVRLVGPRRVEVHTHGAPMEQRTPGQLLEAPGVLKNAVPVEALFDREAALDATLRNLLQRRGHESLEAVRSQGKVQEARKALRRVLARRGLGLSTEQEALIEACDDLDKLESWLDASVTAASADEVF